MSNFNNLLAIASNISVLQYENFWSKESFGRDSGESISFDIEYHGESESKELRKYSFVVGVNMTYGEDECQGFEGFENGFELIETTKEGDEIIHELTFEQQDELLKTLNN